MIYQFATWASLSTLFSIVPIARALTLNVASGGGNASSPILYGILFEVGLYISVEGMLRTNRSRGCISFWRWGFV
jgi:alpha-N-arabinofuranosidase